MRRSRFRACLCSSASTLPKSISRCKNRGAVTGAKPSAAGNSKTVEKGWRRSRGSSRSRSHFHTRNRLRLRLLDKNAVDEASRPAAKSR
jgi:hypothetical protein